MKTILVIFLVIETSLFWLNIEKENYKVACLCGFSVLILTAAILHKRD
jgi:hypothetical protein